MIIVPESWPTLATEEQITELLKIRLTTVHKWVSDGDLTQQGTWCPPKGSGHTRPLYSVRTAVRLKMGWGHGD